ncbi:hypothetical protein [Salipiger bermudensis]|uniref:hypothetical protein n=1 Tax=Salipiger bermudensis TaxID=344736 RepID=UPI001CD7C9B8|nr:hypothetical protein [Salipiger bermudensis]MCA0961260.1 hypothetical protein [Salipiger bermudensis]
MAGIPNRFRLVADPEIPGYDFFQGNTKRTWFEFLNKRFEDEFVFDQIDYRKTTSNAAFRLAGLEVKFGLLRLNEERINGGCPETLSGAILPSIAIDSALAIYSVLEGLTMLSYFCSLTASDMRTEEILKKDRGDKFAKGFKFETSCKATKEIAALKDLRHRCMHQDYADRKDGPDYGEVFEWTKISPHFDLLSRYLTGVALKSDCPPDSNLLTT